MTTLYAGPFHADNLPASDSNIFPSFGAGGAPAIPLPEPIQVEGVLFNLQGVALGGGSIILKLESGPTKNPGGGLRTILSIDTDLLADPNLVDMGMYKYAKIHPVEIPAFEPGMLTAYPRIQTVSLTPADTLSVRFWLVYKQG